VAIPVLVGQDTGEILKRFVEAQKKNSERTMQYTYVEHADFFSIDKDGQAHKNRSETHEIIFVEGLTYKKLVQRNDAPLKAREQTREAKKLRDLAEQRRKDRRSGLFHKTISLGSDEDLLTLFDCHLSGEEKISERTAWVMDCTPKAGHIPANDHEKEVLSFKRKLWIDQVEFVPLRSLNTVVGEHIFMKPGATLTWDFQKVNEDAWLAVSGAIEGRMEIAKFIQPKVRTEYRYSKFQKFDVQSTITVDIPK
jgi:hypothetical protein